MLVVTEAAVKLHYVFSTLSEQPEKNLIILCQAVSGSFRENSFVSTAIWGSTVWSERHFLQNTHLGGESSPDVTAWSIVSLWVVHETTSGSSRVQMTAALLHLGHLHLEALSTDAQGVIPEEITSFPTHEKTTKLPYAWSSVISICSHLPQMLLMLYFTELWKWDLIYWECQNGGKTWGPVATCFRQLLQYQTCEFPHVPQDTGLPLCWKQAPSWRQHLWFSEEERQSGSHIHKGLLTLPVSFLFYFLSEAYLQEANSRGQSCTGRAIPSWQAPGWVVLEASSFLVLALPPRCCAACLSPSPARVHQL